MSSLPGGSGPATNTAEPFRAPNVHIGDSQVRYVNFCRVTGTPEEMILDMGLQTPEGASHQVWEAPQRIALDFYTAKRLVYVLHATLAQFEATFGPVEVDVEKRLAGKTP